MSSFSLTDETAIDVLIFWIESSDGTISYSEQKAVQDVLSSMKYTMKTFNQTISHLGALSTEHLKEVEAEAIQYVKKHFSDEGKRLTYQLLYSVASSDGTPSTEEKKKLEHLQNELGL
ncbi:MAG: hypothetical protein FH748_13890 [Balneolaceae bacterium]|nr:hypothetical protein [Balneolaceae bacterium]